MFPSVAAVTPDGAADVVGWEIVVGCEIVIVVGSTAARKAFTSL